MKTAIEFVNHASVLVTGGETSVLSDPWYRGDAFHKGWNLLRETPDAEAMALLKRCTHIWVSHEHPDHFSILFFKTFADDIKALGVKILFQETRDGRVVSFLRGLGLEVTELRFDTPTRLSDDMRVTCIKDGFYDSGLLMEHAGEKILNLNDCDVTTRARADEVFKVTGTVDVLLTQFSYAAWKGGRENRAWREEAAAEKLQTMRLQIETFRPSKVIPFASFVYFSNSENFYLNDAVNTPARVVDELGDLPCDIRVMQPKDVLGGEAERGSTPQALAFWEEVYTTLPDLPLNTYAPVGEDTLTQEFQTYVARIQGRNSMGLIKLIRRFSPIRAFQPVVVRLTDLEVTLSFDYVTGRIERSDEVPMLALPSESLRFLFANSFGFDTLTVNGCFEEARPGGFVLATKSLAIENLNTLGIHVTPATLFNFPVIKLCLTRLYRVARKLDG